MTDQIRVFAGECTAEYKGACSRVRGRVVVLIKPDDTVLVHDTEGYSPAVWLTQPGSLDIDSGDPRITAVEGDQRLVVRFHELEARTAYAASVAGIPVGPASERAGAFVRRRGCVVDRTTGHRYALPMGGVVLGARCGCGLPLVRVECETEPQCLDTDCEYRQPQSL